MNIEYEATFPNINKDEMRSCLQKAGAVLVKKEFLQRRTVFHLPKGHDIPGAWLRVRDEGDKITMSLKVVDGGAIEDQKEVCVEVGDYNAAVLFLEKIGCIQKAFQESRREPWRLDDTEITIDEWPFLEPFLEIEGGSEELVRAVSEKLELDYRTAIFGAVDVLYEKKYGITPDVINNHTPKIVFEMENPFAGKGIRK